MSISGVIVLYEPPDPFFDNVPFFDTVPLELILEIHRLTSFDNKGRPSNLPYASRKLYNILQRSSPGRILNLEGPAADVPSNLAVILDESQPGRARWLKNLAIAKFRISKAPIHPLLARILAGAQELRFFSLSCPNIAHNENAHLLFMLKMRSQSTFDNLVELHLSYVHQFLAAAIIQECTPGVLKRLRVSAPKDSTPLRYAERFHGKLLESLDIVVGDYHDDIVSPSNDFRALTWIGKDFPNVRTIMLRRTIPNYTSYFDNDDYQDIKQWMLEGVEDAISSMFRMHQLKRLCIDRNLLARWISMPGAENTKVLKRYGFLCKLVCVNLFSSDKLDTLERVDILSGPLGAYSCWRPASVSRRASITIHHLTLVQDSKANVRASLAGDPLRYLKW